MFQHILVPTDGSLLSRKAIAQAVELAKALGAKVTGFYVAPEYHFRIEEDYVSRGYMSRKQYGAYVKRVAKTYLSPLERMAVADGVKCNSDYDLNDSPAEAILKAAKRFKCDTIVMGSHGRSGLLKLFLGSETQKVIQHAKVPVIVVR